MSRPWTQLSLSHLTTQLYHSHPTLPVGRRTATRHEELSVPEGSGGRRASASCMTCASVHLCCIFTDLLLFKGCSTYTCQSLSASWDMELFAIISTRTQETDTPPHASHLFRRRFRRFLRPSLFLLLLLQRTLLLLSLYRSVCGSLVEIVVIVTLFHVRGRALRCDVE